MAIDVSCELATTPVLLIFYKRPGLFDDLNLERSRHDSARAAQTLFVSLFPPKCDRELAVVRFHLVYGPGLRPLGAIGHSPDIRRTRPPLLGILRQRADSRRSPLLLMDWRQAEAHHGHTLVEDRRRQAGAVGSHKQLADRRTRREADSTHTPADSRHRVQDSHNAGTAASSSRPSQPA